MIIPGTHPARIFTVCPLLVTLKVPTITLVVDSVTPHSPLLSARGQWWTSLHPLFNTVHAHSARDIDIFVGG